MAKETLVINAFKLVNLPMGLQGIMRLSGLSYDDTMAVLSTLYKRQRISTMRLNGQAFYELLPNDDPWQYDDPNEPPIGEEPPDDIIS